MKRIKLLSEKNSLQTAWSVAGRDKNYEFYKSSPHFQDLRKWVDKVLFKDKLIDFLDSDYVIKLRDDDFFGRLWELEILEWLSLTKLKLMPTNGIGPDFCLENKDGSKIWIEAVLARPDAELAKKFGNGSLDSPAYKIPNEEIALRYSTSLVGKAKKIKDKYSGFIKPNDHTLIAVSAFPYSSMWPDMDLFMPAILPIEFQVVYFSVDGNQLDEKTPRPTHSLMQEYKKSSGAVVKKEFLYPGDSFPYIDGVIFSEASNLQKLLGRYSSAFSEVTNRPHIFPNYTGKPLPEELTENFYYHKFKEEGAMIALELITPTL